jgi:hypothetical protein
VRTTFRVLIILGIFLLPLDKVMCQKTSNDLFLIIKIDSTSKHYLIRTVRNYDQDTILIISSKNDSLTSNCKSRIQVGESYEFSTANFISNLSIEALPVTPNGFFIRVDEKLIWHNEKHLPLKTIDLLGLSLCPPFYEPN